MREDRPVWRVIPWPLRVAAVFSACLLLVAGAAYLVGTVAVRLISLTLAIVAALLLAALLQPIVDRLAGRRVPRAVGSSIALVVLLLSVAAPIALLWGLVADDISDLGRQFTDGVLRVRRWLVDGPLPLSGEQVDNAGRALLARLRAAAPDPVTGAVNAVEVVGAVLLALVLLFFFLKDGGGMWSWLVRRLPQAHRESLDRAGRAGWRTLTRYARGTLLIAAIDAAGIGIALFALGVPLALPLSLVVFLGGFVPILGATLAGTVAVLVTLATNGPIDALLALAAVITVQQLEGNLLEPLIMGRQLRLHPVVVLVVVAAGALAGGIAGAVLAVPLTAVTYEVARSVLADVRPAPAVPEAGEADL